MLRGLQAQLSRNALTFPAVQQAELAVEAQGKRRQRAFPFPPSTTSLLLSADNTGHQRIPWPSCILPSAFGLW